MASLLDWLGGIGRGIGDFFDGDREEERRPQPRPQPQPKPTYNFGTQTVSRPNAPRPAPGLMNMSLGPLEIKPQNPIPSPTVPKNEGLNKFLGNIVDFTKGSNEAFLGGAIKGAANIAGQVSTGFNQEEAKKRTQEILRNTKQVDQQGNTPAASGADRGSTAFRLGQGVGMAQGVASDLITTALPGAALEKAVRASSIINKARQASQLPARVAGTVAPVVIGGAASSAVNQIKTPEQNAGENFAKGAAFDTAAALLGPVASSAARYIRNSRVQEGRNILPSSLSPMSSQRIPERRMMSSSTPIQAPQVDLRKSGQYEIQRTAGKATGAQVRPSSTQNISLSSSKNLDRDIRMPELMAQNTQRTQTAAPVSIRPVATNLATTRTNPSQTLPSYADTNVTYNPRNEQQAQRGFVGSALENTELPNEIRQVIANSGLNYSVRNTQDLVTRAGNLVNDNPDLARQLANMGNNDVAQALNLELLRKSQAEGNFEEAIDRIEDISRKATESGRATQILAAYGRLTPEGALRFTQRQLSRFNEERGLVGKAKAAKLSPEQAQKITELAKKVQSLPDGVDKERAIVELTQAMKTAAPTPLLQKLTSIWRAGLLTSLRTLEGGALGNTTKAILDAPSQLIAAGVDKAITSRFNNGVRSNVFTPKGAVSGAARGLREAGTYLKTGIDPRDATRAYDTNGINWNQGNKLLNTVGKGSDLVYRGLGAIDNPFYYSALGRANREEALIEASRRGLKGAEARRFADEYQANPSDLSKNAASETAREAVFQNETGLGKLASMLKNSPQSIPNPFFRDAAQAVVDFTIPFAKIPSAVATALVDYSPAGVVLKTVQSIYNKTRGAEVNLRDLNSAIGKSATGTIGAVWLGNELYKRGLLTLEEPADEKERQLWAAEGKQKFSVKIGNRWYNMNYLQPLGGLMALGGGYERASKSGDMDPLLAGALTGVKSVTEQSFLQGINDLVKLGENPLQNGGQFFNSKVSSFVPNIVKDAARATDTYERETNTVQDAFNNSIPGLRQNSLPQRDPFGAPIQVRQSPAGVFLDPFKSTKAKDDEVTGELRRLYDADPKELGIVPTKLQENQSFSGESVKLTPQQLDKYEALAGPDTYSQIYQVMSDPRYKSLSDEERSKTIKSVIDANRAEAKREIVADGGLKNKKGENVVVNPNDIKIPTASFKTDSANETYADKYQAAVADFERDGNTLSLVQRKKKADEIQKLSVQKDFDKDTVDLYGMSKEDVYNILTKEKNGKELTNKLLAYDDALVKAGLRKYSKFRDRNGAVSIAPRGKSTGGRKGKGRKAPKFDVKSRLLPKTKVPTIGLPPSSKGGANGSTPKLRPTQIRRTTSKAPRAPSIRVRDGIA